MPEALRLVAQMVRHARAALRRSARAGGNEAELSELRSAVLELITAVEVLIHHLDAET